MKWIFIILAIPLIASAQTLETNILRLDNASPQEIDRITDSLELIEQVVSSDDFRERVLAMEYKVGSKTRPGFSQTNLSPSEILESIYNARENFDGGTDGVMDLNLVMYRENSGTIAYTSPGDMFIHLNRFYHDDFTVVETAGNLFHEWLHKLGHGHHGGRYNRFRKHSVPYKLGVIVSQMVAEISSEGDPLLKAMLSKSGQLLCHH